MFAVDVREQIPPRKRRCPDRFEDGNRDTYYYDDTPKSKAKREYFAALDSARNAIQDRFCQESNDTYEALSALIKDAIAGKPYQVSDELQQLYSDDIDFEHLRVQLSLLNQLIVDKTSFSVLNFASWLKSSSSRSYLDEVEKLAKLLLTFPATNASSERCFSALKRIKTGMRSSMTQSRLNSVSLLHIYKDKTDLLNNEDIVREFVNCHVDRAKTIGTQ